MISCEHSHRSENMNQRNCRQFYEQRAPIRTQLNFFEPLHWPREAFVPSTGHPVYRQGFGALPNSAELGICDGMNNCHMTESWTSVLARSINPHVQRLSSEVPIVNPYVSLRLPFEVQPSMQQATIDDSFSHRTLKASATWRDFEFTKPNPRHPIAPHCANLGEAKIPSQKRLAQRLKCFDSEVVINEEKIQTSVKFQDRNQRQDFKVNFRRKNRKVDGCFHNDDGKSPVDTMSNVAVPSPKKKWIRHYMTGKILTDFVRSLGVTVLRSRVPGNLYFQSFVQKSLAFREKTLFLNCRQSPTQG